MPGSALGTGDVKIFRGRDSDDRGGKHSEAPWEARKYATITMPAHVLSLGCACLLDSQTMLSQSNCYICMKKQHWGP